MKPVQKLRSVDAFGVQETSEFSIKASPKAFQILSSGLYSNKIRAIVRELSCNAWDSHVAAGTTDKPFVVKIPNSLDPTFSIRDYGTGLSHEDVMSLYTTYFESTKVDSNDYVGALGLGSKSPLCYADTFTVTSFYNGMKRVYTVYMDKGFPHCSIVHEEPTNEENGLEVLLVASADDQYEFEQEIANVLYFFPVQPRFLGNPSFRIEDYVDGEVIFEGTGWKMYNRGCYPFISRGVYAKQGLVVYPISYDILRELGHHELANKVILFEVPIGTLDVAASREQLSYIDETKKAIQEILNNFQKELICKIQEGIDKERSLWDAVLKWKLFKNEFSIKDDVFYKGYHNLNEFLVVKKPKYSLMVYRQKVSRRSARIVESDIKVPFRNGYAIRPTDVELVIFEDCSGCKNKIRKYMVDNNLKSVLLVSDPSRKYNITDMRRWLKRIGCRPKAVLRTSTLAKLYRVKRKKRSAAVQVEAVFIKLNVSSDKITSKTLVIPKKWSDYYPVIDGSEKNISKSYLSFFHTVLNWLFQDLDLDMVAACSASSYKKIQKTEKFLTYEEALEIWWNKPNTKKDMIERVLRSYVHRLETVEGVISKLPPTHELQEYMSLVQKRYDHCSLGDCKVVLPNRVYEEIESKIHDEVEKYNRIVNKYTLLFEVNPYYASPSVIEDLVWYAQKKGEMS